MMLMLILLLDIDDSEEYDKAPSKSPYYSSKKAGVKRTPKGGRTKGGTTSDCRAEGARLGAAADRY